MKKTEVLIVLFSFVLVAAITTAKMWYVETVSRDAADSAEFTLAATSGRSGLRSFVSVYSGAVLEGLNTYKNEESATISETNSAICRGSVEINRDGKHWEPLFVVCR